MLIPVTRPFKYAPAHSEVLFKFTYESKPCVSIVNANFQGYATIVLDMSAGNYVDIGGPNQMIFLDSGSLKGFHKIRQVLLNGIIQLETLFNLNDTTYNCNAYLITNHTLDIYAGYNPPSLFENVRERKKIATLRPEPVSQYVFNQQYKPFLNVDISGYLKSVFSVQSILEDLPYDSLISSNATSIKYLHGLFSQYEVWINEFPYFTGIAVNSSLTGEEFELKYNGTNRFLTNELPAYISSNCTTIVNKVNDTGVYIVAFQDGDIITPTEQTLDELLSA